MILKLENLEKSYPTPHGSLPVLKGVNLELKPGETVAILGQSGSGKSTLLSLVAGLDHPSQGSVILDGTRLEGLKESHLSRYRAEKLGIVFQQFHLMPHLTALENVSLPLELTYQKQAKARAAFMLEAVGLSSRADHFPRQLSGGECQRVAIARALGVEPALLLADEPTGNLDEANGAKVAQLLFDLVAQQQMTLLLVTHNRDLAARCQRRLTLREGRLNADPA